MTFDRTALKRLRESKGYNMSETANLCGMKRQQYEGIEKGKHTPSLGTIDVIAKALGVPGKFLITD